MATVSLEDKFATALESMSLNTLKMASFMESMYHMQVDSMLGSSVRVHDENLSRLVELSENQLSHMKESEERRTTEQNLEDVGPTPGPTPDSSDGEDDNNNEEDKPESIFKKLFGNFGKILTGAIALPFVYQFAKGFVDELTGGKFTEIQDYVIGFFKDIDWNSVGDSLKNVGTLFFDFIENPLTSKLGLAFGALLVGPNLASALAPTLLRVVGMALLTNPVILAIAGAVGVLSAVTKAFRYLSDQELNKYNVAYLETMPAIERGKSGGELSDAESKELRRLKAETERFLQTSQSSEVESDLKNRLAELNSALGIIDLKSSFEGDSDVPDGVFNESLDIAKQRTGSDDKEVLFRELIRMGANFGPTIKDNERRIIWENRVERWRENTDGTGETGESSDLTVLPEGSTQSQYNKNYAGTLDPRDTSTWSGSDLRGLMYARQGALIENRGASEEVKRAAVRAATENYIETMTEQLEAAAARRSASDGSNGGALVAPIVNNVGGTNVQGGPTYNVYNDNGSNASASLNATGK